MSDLSNSFISNSKELHLLLDIDFPCLLLYSYQKDRLLMNHTGQNGAKCYVAIKVRSLGLIAP